MGEFCAFLQNLAHGWRHVPDFSGDARFDIGQHIQPTAPPLQHHIGVQLIEINAGDPNASRSRGRRTPISLSSLRIYSFLAIGMELEFVGRNKIVPTHSYTLRSGGNQNPLQIVTVSHRWKPLIVTRIIADAVGGTSQQQVLRTSRPIHFSHILFALLSN